MGIYLSTFELSERIKYNECYIREHLKDTVFVKGVHYIKPFGGRKILYVWEEIEQILSGNKRDKNPMDGIPLKKGRAKKWEE